MRHYPANSPEAAGRLLALALLADGAIDPAELAVLQRQEILERLGLSAKQFDTLIHEFCEDLLASAHRSPCGNLELGCQSLRHLFADVRDRRLQRELLRAMLAIVHADVRLGEGEATLLMLATESWDMQLYEAARIDVSRGRRWAPAGAAGLASS